MHSIVNHLRGESGAEGRAHTPSLQVRSREVYNGVQ